MAVVYLAEDITHHRKGAVKVLRPEVAAALGADRFLREIELAAGLGWSDTQNDAVLFEIDGYRQLVVAGRAGNRVWTTKANGTRE